MNIIKGYAKDNKTFSAANNEFNNKINIAEKRAILVAMHKLGIPIINTEKDTFNIKEIRFGNRTIDSIEINDIILQIEKGHCDNLFSLKLILTFPQIFGLKLLEVLPNDLLKKY